MTLMEAIQKANDAGYTIFFEKQDDYLKIRLRVFVDGKSYSVMRSITFHPRYSDYEKAVVLVVEHLIERLNDELGK